jgi:hypothetical protein
MRSLSQIDVPWWPEPGTAISQIRVWRPLLQEPKSEIETYVSAHGLVPNQDESNVDPGYKRNAIRHHLLPAMEQEYPSTRDALARFAVIAAAEDELITRLAAAALEQIETPVGSLSLDSLLAQGVAIQRRVVLSWLREAADTSEVTLERVDAVLELARSRSETRRVEVASGCSAAVIQGDLVAGNREELQRFAWARFPGPWIGPGDRFPLRLVIDRPHRLERVEFRLESSSNPGGAEGIDWVRLPASHAAEAVWLRRLQPGDRFAQREQQAQEWLRRHRVPVCIRCELVCVADAEQVLWIPGLPIPERVDRPSNQSQLIVRWTESQTPEE